jgi:hypothetical protein
MGMYPTSINSPQTVKKYSKKQDFLKGQDHNNQDIIRTKSENKLKVGPEPNQD